MVFCSHNAKPLHRVVQALAEQLPEVTSQFFPGAIIDDIGCIIPAEAVECFLTLVDNAFSHQRQPLKCKIWVPWLQHGDAVPQCVSGPKAHECKTVTQGLILTGTPIGTDAFISEYCLAIVRGPLPQQQLPEALASEFPLPSPTGKSLQ